MKIIAFPYFITFALPEKKLILNESIQKDKQYCRLGGAGVSIISIFPNGRKERKLLGLW